MKARIGLEIHVQLKTRTKLFCSCPTKSDSPNSNVCPICTGMPGVLPVPNRKAVVLALRACKLLNLKVHRKSVFARKNYFYPDLPKNYQISQYDQPLATDGYLELSSGKKIRIQRLHIEEDAGKMIHEGDVSYVDFSRSGVPLVEIVTMPDIETPDEAYEFLTTLHKILVWCDVTEGSMEEGNLRCDVNVSVEVEGKKGDKVEIKNINSFRFIKQAIEWEIRRQAKVLENGGKVERETRLFDPDTGKTYPMRTKEFAHDYRYFPDPDLLPLEITDDMLREAEEGMPELPETKKQKFVKMGISEYSANILTSQRYIAEFFESLAGKVKDIRKLANFILEEVLRAENEGLCDIRKQKDELVQIIGKIFEAFESGKITWNSVKLIFQDTLKGEDVKKLIEERSVVSDEGRIEKVVDEVLETYPNEVERYKKGEKKLLGYFIGEVMKRMGRKADPKKVRELLIKKLGQ